MERIFIRDVTVMTSLEIAKIKENGENILPIISNGIWDENNKPLYIGRFADKVDGTRVAIDTIVSGDVIVRLDGSELLITDEMTTIPPEYDVYKIGVQITNLAIKFNTVNLPNTSIDKFFNPERMVYPEHIQHMTSANDITRHYYLFQLLGKVINTGCLETIVNLTEYQTYPIDISFLPYNINVVDTLWELVEANGVLVLASMGNIGDY